MADTYSFATCPSEIVFVAEVDPDCGYIARAVGESIFTQGDTLEDLKAMVLDAVDCHLDDNLPRRVRLILPTLEMRVHPALGATSPRRRTSHFQRGISIPADAGTRRDRRDIAAQFGACRGSRGPRSRAASGKSTFVDSPEGCPKRRMHPELQSA